jgi:amino acid permease
MSGSASRSSNRLGKRLLMGNSETMSQGHFKRVLDSKEVLALAFGAMIGWGWVVLAGGWVQSAGSLGAILAFAIGGVAVILIGLTYAELASAMPLTGGEHVYAYRAMGMGASFLCTWAIILGYVSVVAFEAVALPTVIEHLFPNYKVGLLWNVAGWDVYFTWALVGSVGAVAMTWINILGIKTCALLQKVVTLLIVVGTLPATGPGAHPRAEHQRLPAAGRGPRRRHRGGDRRRRSRDGVRGVPGTGAERGRLLPAARRLLPARA